MQSQAKTVAEYLASLPDDRRKAIEAVRNVIRKNLDKGYEERMSYGMIGYVVPHSIYPAGYHCDPKQPLPFAGLASQKNHISVYLMSVYGQDEDWFRKEWAKSGKKLDMGKCCVRFKKLEDANLDVIGQAVKRLPVPSFIKMYESNLQEARVARESRQNAKAASQARSGSRGAAKKAAANLDNVSRARPASKKSGPVKQSKSKTSAALRAANSPGKTTRSARVSTRTSKSTRE